MQIESDKRVQKIRAKVQKERQSIFDLEGRLGDDKGVKQLLGRASNTLDDVEGFFLDTKILQEPRSPSKLTRWLAETEKWLQIAVQQRQYVEKISKQLGPNIKSFSD